MRRIVALILAALFFTGCLRQDWSLCTQRGNLLLSFAYELPGKANAFSNYIDNVDVALYDRDLKLVEYRRLGRSELAALQGTRFEVEAGDYHVVCWGNVGINSASYDGGMRRGYPVYEHRLRMISPDSGCPLYYAPSTNIVGDSAAPDYSGCKITVPENGSVEKKIEFLRAHRTLNIYVQNYKENKAAAPSPLTVSVTNLPEEYDFMMRSGQSRRRYTQNTHKAVTPDGEMMMARIHTPYYTISEEINLHIDSCPDGNPICTPINIKEYIENNSADLPPRYPNDAGLIAGRYPHEIDIVIKLMADGTVSIAAPKWGESDVDPVWNR